jgi:rhamnosyltransferase
MESNYPTIKNTAALIVSFHPSRDLVSRIAKISPQVDRVLVVDNTPNDSDLPVPLESINPTNFTLIANRSNLGQATALNIGVKQIIEWGYDWILLLDQDSLVSADFMESMSVTYQNYHSSDDVVSLCPLLVNYDGISEPNQASQKPWSFSGKPITGDAELVKIAITSGNLIRSNIFKQVGFFEDRFFINYVDIEFCLRLSKFNYRVLQSNSTILYHNIGNAKQHKIPGLKTISSNNDSSIRNYYFYRNGVITYKRYLFTDSAWIAKDLIRGFLFRLAKIILFEEGKVAKVFEMFKGLLHGFLNIQGAY